MADYTHLNIFELMLQECQATLDVPLCRVSKPQIFNYHVRVHSLVMVCFEDVHVPMHQVFS